jgi:hypothetical protein
VPIRCLPEDFWAVPWQVLQQVTTERARVDDVWGVRGVQSWPFLLWQTAGGPPEKETLWMGFSVVRGLGALSGKVLGVGELFSLEVLGRREASVTLGAFGLWSRNLPLFAICCILILCGSVQRWALQRGQSGDLFLRASSLLSVLDSLLGCADCSTLPS